MLLNDIRLAPLSTLISGLVMFVKGCMLIYSYLCLGIVCLINNTNGATEATVVASVHLCI